MFLNKYFLTVFNRNRRIDREYYVRQTDQVTDLTFGGLNNDTMIITTASVDFNGKNKKKHHRGRYDDDDDDYWYKKDCSGFLLQIKNMNVRGQDNNRIVIN